MDRSQYTKFILPPDSNVMSLDMRESELASMELSTRKATRCSFSSCISIILEHNRNFGNRSRTSLYM